MKIVLQRIIPCIIFLLPVAIRAQGEQEPGDTLAYGLLIPASATMQRAWDIPRNPLLDSATSDPGRINQIRYGYKIFTSTSTATDFLTGNSMSCSNCHLNGGQREKALPLVGISAVYPEFNKRAGRLFTVEDRIVECFKRSLDASRFDPDTLNTAARDSSLARLRQSKEVQAITAYIDWLSKDVQQGGKIAWRGQNSIPEKKTIPVDRLDTSRGHSLYTDKCISCHGEDGAGVFIGDKKAGPLWGDESWNDGAGAARVYTLAGIIRYMMPYLDPGSLTDEEAQCIAAYINTRRRPVYPFKARDYRGIPLPEDAVYYHRDGNK